MQLQVALGQALERDVDAHRDGDTSPEHDPAIGDRVDRRPGTEPAEPGEQRRHRDRQQHRDDERVQRHGDRVAIVEPAVEVPGHEQGAIDRHLARMERPDGEAPPVGRALPKDVLALRQVPGQAGNGLVIVPAHRLDVVGL
jgi:hypothetical protein